MCKNADYKSYSAYYMSRGTIFSSESSSSLTLFVDTDIFHWRRSMLSHFPDFGWLSCREGKRNALKELEIILWRLVPPSPIKKRTRALPASQVGVETKLYAQVSPLVKPALKGQRRKVGDVISIDWKKQTILLIHELIHWTFRFPPDRPPILRTVGANVEM